MNSRFAENNNVSTESKSSAYSMSKVFLWMFLAILITGLTSFTLPYALVALNAENLYYGIMIGCLIAVLVLGLIGTRVIATTPSKSLAITVFVLYSIAMGGWISPLMVLYDLQSVSFAFLGTAGIFGIMGLYGYFTKRDLTNFGTFLMMMLIGALILTIINFFIKSDSLAWILSYAILAFYIGFIAYDIQKVKRFAENGQLNHNVSLLMALNLYIDFVYIFIRLLQLFGNSKR